MRLGWFCTSWWWVADRIRGKLGKRYDSRFWRNRLWLGNRIYRRDGRLRQRILLISWYSVSRWWDWVGVGHSRLNRIVGLGIFLGNCLRIIEYNRLSNNFLVTTHTRYAISKQSRISNSTMSSKKTKCFFARVPSNKCSRAILLSSSVNN